MVRKVSNQETDALVKPDMRAVLARTHLSKNQRSLLLPVMEAISNAIHSIEARFGTAASVKGRISVHFAYPNDPEKFKVTVQDNGIGLNNENYQHFKTPFSGHKLQQNGRGFGRFIAFKIFEHIAYASRYAINNVSAERHFVFDIGKEDEFIFREYETPLIDVGLKVTFSEPIPEWGPVIQNISVDHVADDIASHFLPYFLYKTLPEIHLQFDEGASQSITHLFRSIFVESDSGSFECEIESELELIKYSIARIPRTKSFKSHCLLFSAADRIVGSPRDIANKIGHPFFIDEDNQKYIVIATLRSEAFESRLNDARTSINIPPKTIEDIVDRVCHIIENGEQEQIAKIKYQQAVDLNEVLRDNPILRLGLRGRSISEYVAAKPNNWTAEKFVSDLAIERLRATNDLIKAIVSAAGNPQDYDRNIADIVGKIDDAKKEILAEYVVHRKSVIELLSATRRFALDGMHHPEDAIHELVFRRFKDNTNLDYFDHNLWLVDDALAFVPYVSSDRTIHGGARQKGDKIADLTFFEESLLLGDNDGTSITIVEFKKPSRDDYRLGVERYDPVLQVIRTLERATAAGGIKRTDGSHFHFSGVVRRYAYIIADHTKSLAKLLRDYDFKNHWNPNIYYRFRDNEQIYIESFGYDTLVENAKKRNQAFFRVLLDE